MLGELEAGEMAIDAIVVADGELGYAICRVGHVVFCCVGGDFRADAGVVDVTIGRVGIRI